MFDAMLILVAKAVFVLFLLWYLVCIALALYELLLQELNIFVSVPQGLRVVLLRGETMANVLTYRVSVNAPVDGEWRGIDGRDDCRCRDRPWVC